MNKTLLLVLFWAVCTTLSFGQSGTNLDRATRFAILASTEVTNTGTTTVTGDLGISPGSTINDSGTLTVTGTRDLGNPAAAGALADAQMAYNELWTNTAAPLTSPIGNSRTIQPGVYRISGDAELNGFLTLDGRRNPDSKFIFLIDGNFTSAANASILLSNGAEAKNVYWVVEGNSTVLGSNTLFYGSILAKGDITLSDVVGLTGRAISLGGAVHLRSSRIQQPIPFEANLKVEKSVAAGDYIIGDQVTYTIKATNNGPTNAINVVVSENFPAGLTFVSASPANEYNATTGEWTIGTLMNEEVKTLTLVFQITQPGTLQNSVSITGDYNDPDLSDNTATATVTATCPALPTIAISGNTEICDPNQTVTYTATLVEGATYNFNLPDGWTLVSQQDNVLEVKVGVTGTLGVTVTDQCSRTASGSLAVTVVAAPATPDVNGNDLICDIAQTYTYTASGVSENVTYTWIVGGSFVIESGQGTASVVVRATSLAEGTISLRTTNVCDISSESAPKTVKVSATPEAPVIAGENAEVCVGTTVTYNIATPVTGETYTWRLTGDLVLAEGSDLTGNDISVVVNGDGALFASATNECGTSATEGTLAITTITKPAAPGTVTGPAAVCRLSTGNTYSVPAVEGVTYKWTVPAGWSFTGDGTNTITASAGESAEAGNITVVGNNKCGDSNATTFAVTLKEKPEMPTIAGDETACVSATPVIYSVTPVEGVTYTWSVSGDISIDGASDAATVNVIVNGAGVLTVTATNECGPTTATKTITPTARLAAPANVSSSVTGEICEGQQVTLTAEPVTGADSYTWDIPAGIEVVSTDRTTNTLVVIANATATVRVAGVNKCGTGDFASLTVDVTPKPAAPSISGDLTACVNATTPVTYSVAPVDGATSYTWVATGGLTISGSNEGLSVSVLVNGAGTLTATSVTNTCAGGSTTVTVNPSVVPATPGAITGPAAVCRASSGHTYSVPAVDGVTYKWTVPTGWTFTGDGTNTIVATAGESAEAGNITVVANNKCGDSDATTFGVTLKEKPAAPSITGDATACIGTTPVTYSVPAVTGQTYTWRLTGGIALAEGSDLEGENVSVIINGAGSIFVTATNECGTGAEGTLEINPTTTLAAPVNLRSDASSQICEGQRVVFNVDAVAGADSYNWNLPSGWTPDPASTTTQLVAIAGASGTVTVSANNKCGAGAVASLDVTVTPTPAAPAITSSNDAPCINTAVTYTVSPVTGITHVWTLSGDYTVGGDGDLTGDEITVTLNGTVTIAVSGANGACSGPATTLTVNPITAPATPGAITGPAEVCVNSTGNVFTVAEVAGATTYNWLLPEGWEITAGENTNSITVTATSTGGEVIVEVSNTCFPDPVQSAPLAVSMSTPPAAVTAITDNSTLCGGLTYTIAPVTGAASYNWVVTAGFEIEQGQGTTTVKVRRTNSNTTEGSITVTPVNALGCAGASFAAPIDARILDGQLSFPKAFSPNGDGNNDTWVITNLEQFTENEVTIFNRYGSEVYRKKNYQNDWTGNGLEKGTYFYKVRVKLCDGAMREFTGYTTIFR